MSTEEIVPTPGVPAPVDVPTVPTPALPLDLMPIAPWVTAEHLQEPLEAPVLAEESLDGRRARIQPWRRLSALSGRDWIHVGLVALLSGALIFGLGIYAVRQSRHIQALDAAWHAEGNRANAQTDRANGLDADLTSTRSDLSNTRSVLNSTQIDRDTYKGRVSTAEATAAAAAGKVTTAQAETAAMKSQRDAVAAHEETRRLACGDALTIMNNDWGTFAKAVLNSIGGGVSPATGTSPELKDAMNRCLNKSALGV